MPTVEHTNVEDYSKIYVLASFDSYGLPLFVDSLRMPPGCLFDKAMAFDRNEAAKAAKKSERELYVVNAADYYNFILAADQQGFEPKYKTSQPFFDRIFRRPNKV